MRIATTGPNSAANIHQTDKTDKWSASTKLLAVSGAVALLALAVIKAANLYTDYQNGQISAVDCPFGQEIGGVLRDFTYYKNAAEKNGATASDQYCFGRMHEIGQETTKNLGEARNWYKKAAAQGLNFAKRELCKPSMFEHHYGSFEEYQKYQDIFGEYTSQFASLCCQRPFGIFVSPSLPPRCPWEKYESFRPHFKQCYPELDIGKLHTRELLAMTVIRNALIEKSLLQEEEPPYETNQYLQLCKDDPREKVLVLSADYDGTGVDKDGTIVLMGGSLGQNGSNENNIAQKIANDTKRTVLATTCPIFPSDTNIQSIYPLVLNHPGYSGVYNFFFMGCSENDDNHFKTFYPKI